VFSRWHFYRIVDGRYVWDEDGETKSVRVDECFRFATADTAYTKNTWSDYSVFLVMDYSTEHGRGFIRHVQREKIEGPGLPDWLVANSQRWNPVFIGVEDAGSGKQFLQEMRKDNRGLAIRALPADKDKVSRAYPYAFQTVGGTYMLPAEAEWVSEFTEEHSLFPGAGKHDDQVDAGAYAHVVAKDLPKYKRAPEGDPEDADSRAARHIANVRKTHARNKRRRTGATSRLRGRL
jgi:predicted phage terminase large subunit-like protein